MHSLYLCTAYIHIGSEEDIPVEFVVVKEENLQEQQPEEDEQDLELLLSNFVILLTSIKASPIAF
jgi:hypothetical protein